MTVSQVCATVPSFKEMAVVDFPMNDFMHTVKCRTHITIMPHLGSATICAPLHISRLTTDIIALLLVVDKFKQIENCLPDALWSDDLTWAFGASWASGSICRCTFNKAFFRCCAVRGV